MKALFPIAVLVLLPFQSVLAAEQLASEASVRELLAVSQSRKTMDDTMAQMDSAMRNGMKQGMGNATPTAEQQQIMDSMVPKLVALFAEEMSWDKMEPKMVKVYQQTFSQSEVDGLLTFYRSKAGKALIAKMPLVMQNVMQMTQANLANLLPKLQQLQSETAAELKAAKAQ
jgi:hypothetical protein